MKNTLVALLMISISCATTPAIVTTGISQAEACSSAQVQSAISAALPFLLPLLAGGKINAQGLANAEAQYGEAAVSCISTDWLNLATSTLVAGLAPDAGAVVAPATVAATLTQMDEVHKYLGKKIVLRQLLTPDAGH